jgi:hypothetical protein
MPPSAPPATLAASVAALAAVDAVDADAAVTVDVVDVADVADVAATAMPRQVRATRTGRVWFRVYCRSPRWRLAGDCPDAVLFAGVLAAVPAIALACDWFCLSSVFWHVIGVLIGLQSGPP